MSFLLSRLTAYAVTENEAALLEATPSEDQEENRT